MALLVLFPGAMNHLLNSPSGPVGRRLYAGAVRVQNAAKQRANVATGLMRSDIHIEMAQDGQGLYADIGTNVYYAFFVHQGTRYYGGNPFLVDALPAFSP